MGRSCVETSAAFRTMQAADAAEGEEPFRTSGKPQSLGGAFPCGETMPAEVPCGDPPKQAARCSAPAGAGVSQVKRAAGVPQEFPVAQPVHFALESARVRARAHPKSLPCAAHRCTPCTPTSSLGCAHCGRLLRRRCPCPVQYSAGVCWPSTSAHAHRRGMFDVFRHMATLAGADSGGRGLRTSTRCFS